MAALKRAQEGKREQVTQGLTRMLGNSPSIPALETQNLTVGSYIVETDYWNQSGCPGTQCMTVNTTTGAFSVTQGPDCGDTVASYPNDSRELFWHNQPWQQAS